MKRTWSEEDMNKLRALWPEKSICEIMQHFPNHTQSAIRGKAKVLKLKKNSAALQINSNSFWNRERILFLKENYSLKTAREIGEFLGCNRTCVKNQAVRLGLTKDTNTGHYKKDHIPANKGTKGLVSGNSGSFKKGSIPHNTLYDGAITTREFSSGVSYKFIRLSKNRWEFLHRYLWMHHNGEIPFDMIVVFKDGDSMNCKIENLELITKQQHAENTRNSDGYIAAKLAANGLGTYDKEMQIIFLQEPELINAKRQQKILNKLIKEHEAATKQDQRDDRKNILMGKY